MKTAAAYIRVSTEDQLEYSPASQLEKIREYAKQNDYILPDEFIFMDEGISGRTIAKRPAFNKMIGIAKIKPKPFDAILLWKFSRFARNREDSIVYKSMLRKQCGIDVISVSESLGDDKMSVIIEAMIEAMDEYYSINLAEEVKRGMNEKASRGQAVTIPSFGYQIKNGKYIPDPEAAPVVQKIFADYLNGTGMRTIARELNDAGYRTRRGNFFENRTVRYILHNPVYIGKIRWNPNGKTNYQNDSEANVIDAGHEPIIDIGTWERVQSKSVPRSKYMRDQSAKDPFMLQGLCRCSACGATLCQSSAHKSLQCYAYAHGKCKTSHGIAVNKINTMVFEALESIINDDTVKIKTAPHVTSRRSTDVSALIERESKKLQRVRDAYENGVYTLDEYKTSRNKITAAIEKIRQEHQEEPKDAAVEREALRNKIVTILPTLRSPAVTETQKSNLLKSIIERIVFYRSTCDIDIFFYS